MKIDDYRKAINGEGCLADTWTDKPHRLVYDLCNEAYRLVAGLNTIETACSLLLPHTQRTHRCALLNIEQLRNAPSGDGVFGRLWKSSPGLIITKLCDNIEAMRTKILNIRLTILKVY